MGTIGEKDKLIIRITPTQYKISIQRLIPLAWTAYISQGKLIDFYINVNWMNAQSEPPVLVKFQCQTVLRSVINPECTIKLPVYAPSIKPKEAVVVKLHAFCREHGIHSRLTHHHFRLVQ